MCVLVSAKAVNGSAISGCGWFARVGVLLPNLSFSYPLSHKIHSGHALDFVRLHPPSRQLCHRYRRRLAHGRRIQDQAVVQRPSTSLRWLVMKILRAGTSLGPDAQHRAAYLTASGLCYRQSLHRQKRYGRAEKTWRHFKQLPTRLIQQYQVGAPPLSRVELAVGRGQYCGPGRFIRSHCCV